MLSGQVAVVAGAGGELARALAAALGGAGCRVVTAGAAGPADAREMLQGVAERFGGLDVVVCAESAGDAYPFCRAALTLMAPRRRGQIVQVAAVPAGYGPGALADLLDREGRPRGIRVTGIYPEGALGAEAVAAAVMFALTQPLHLRVDRLVLQRMR